MFNLILGIILGIVISIIIFVLLAIINDEYIIDIILFLIGVIFMCFTMLVISGAYHGLCK